MIKHRRVEARTFKDVAARFKALSHPVRLRIATRLMEGECCVGDLQRCLSISQPNVSQHLRILKEARIIAPQRKKNKICYRIADEACAKIIDIFFRGE